jgi:hypothetical protein
MIGHNYPNHRLFRITPLLDKGFQTVRFDPYEQVLIAKIQAGRYSADLWDCNGLHLDYAQRIGSSCYQQKTAIPSRYEFTPERRKEYLEAVREEMQAEAARRAQRQQERAEKEAKRKAERTAAQIAQEAQEAAARAERVRVLAEWERRKVELEAERALRAAEWEAESKRITAERQAKSEVEQLDKERIAKECASVLAGAWECQQCQTRSLIEPIASGYVLTCRSCGRTSWAPHETFALIVARNTQLKPLSDG